MTTTTALSAAPRGRDDHWLTVTQPTALTRFFRTFLPWQLIRFVAINLKMVRIIMLSHRPRFAGTSPHRGSRLQPPA